MNKGLAFVLIVITGTLLAGLYGLFHNQITFAIGPEYFTRFKFIQFNLVSEMEIVPSPKWSAAVVGFKSTWWVGLVISAILALVGTIHVTGKMMYGVTLRAILITLLASFLVGLMGLAYGFNAAPDSLAYIPDTVDDVKNFVAAGWMHNFSYIGGAIGMIFGIMYSVRAKRKYQMSRGY